MNSTFPASPFILFFFPFLISSLMALTTASVLLLAGETSSSSRIRSLGSVMVILDIINLHNNYT